MSVAQPMQAGVTEVWLPEVVNGSPNEVGQDTDLIHGFRSAFAVDVVIGCVGR